MLFCPIMAILSVFAMRTQFPSTAFS
jgi:hypothetical protein